MIERHVVDDGRVEVTFRVPGAAGAQSAAVVGEFNDWSTTATRLTADDDGLVAVVTLRPGRPYRFRYLLDGQRWENDWAADAYADNEFGGQDSVVDLTMVGREPAEDRAASDAATPRRQPHIQ